MSTLYFTTTFLVALSAAINEGLAIELSHVTESNKSVNGAQPELLARSAPGNGTVEGRSVGPDGWVIPICSVYTGLLHDHEYCNKYKVCELGKEYHKVCDPPKLFDDKRLICDHPKNVDCGRRKVIAGGAGGGAGLDDGGKNKDSEDYVYIMNSEENQGESHNKKNTNKRIEKHDGRNGWKDEVGVEGRQEGDNSSKDYVYVMNSEEDQGESHNKSKTNKHIEAHGGRSGGN